MNTVHCKGEPLQIGLQHGESATEAIKRSILFYSKLFEENCKLEWDDVCQVASKFLPFLRQEWPWLCEEMNGVAQGAGVPFLSILAINVRTEIAYGMFSDGCTSVAWKTNTESFLAQNWDWQSEQTENLIHLRISRTSKPSIDMITEAGIIGKIGFNDSGVGTCLNAIKALGVDFGKLPCHLALRVCLDSTSRDEAVSTLHRYGVASACHILVADVTGGRGLECTHQDIVDLPMSTYGRLGVITHTNHFIRQHSETETTSGMPDTIFRLRRINELVGSFEGEPHEGDIASFLKDEMNYPASINRGHTEESTVQTLFSIIMDLEQRTAHVKIGRPTENGAEVVLSTE
ncbi:hypothetical protein MMC25_001901 [Agyrium rufum]|nr:hypothetical protein [Agyrium rufum]